VHVFAIVPANAAQIARIHQRAARRRDVIALAGGLPCDELFPRIALAAAFARTSADEEALQYGWPEGMRALRAWIAERLAARGIAVAAEHVIVTAGAQQALALVAGALDVDRIAVGDATYPAALAAFARSGITAVTTGAPVRYVIAGVGNPHGVDVCDRSALDGEVVIDEAYTELRFDGRDDRLVPHDSERTWRIGTLSKTLCPGLRIGWLVPPPRHHARVVADKQAADLQTCSVAQSAAIRLLATIDYDALIARARSHYAARADRLATALRRACPELRFRDPEGGFSIWVETDETGDDVALLEAAIAAGVSLDPGCTFRCDGATSHVAFRLSYSHAAMCDLDEGPRRLARALAAWRRGPRPS
jgi:2-aminoadipate transaminase